MSTLLSILIPTKDRYKTLIPCVETLLKIDSDLLEIVIQDNSDDNSEFVKYLDTRNADRIRYFYESKYVSVSENINLAVQHSIGDFVCCIGDDDAVSTKIIEIAIFMKKNYIQSCSFEFARYYWPDMEESMNNYKPLFIPDIMDGAWRIVNPKQELISIMQSNVFEINRLSIIYHGIIARSVLEEIYKRTGTICPGPSPDLANATAASILVKKHVFINIPLTIAGSSFKSGSGMGTRRKHVRELNEVPWISKEAKDTWERKVPKVWTAETVWSESLIKAIKNMKEEQMLKFFNYQKLYANFILHHPGLIIRALNASPMAAVGLIVYGPGIILKKMKRTLKISKLETSNVKGYDLEDNTIEGAFNFVNSFNDKIILHEI